MIDWLGRGRRTCESRSGLGQVTAAESGTEAAQFESGEAFEDRTIEGVAEAASGVEELADAVYLTAHGWGSCQGADGFHACFSTGCDSPRWGFEGKDIAVDVSKNTVSCDCKWALPFIAHHLLSFYTSRCASGSVPWPTRGWLRANPAFCRGGGFCRRPTFHPTS